jgi:hypothetical protein
LRREATAIEGSAKAGVAKRLKARKRFMRPSLQELSASFCGKEDLFAHFSQKPDVALGLVDASDAHEARDHHVHRAVHPTGSDSRSGGLGRRPMSSSAGRTVPHALVVEDFFYRPVLGHSTSLPSPRRSGRKQPRAREVASEKHPPHGRALLEGMASRAWREEQRGSREWQRIDESRNSQRAWR